MDYTAFLESRRQYHNDHGFAPVWMPEFLFDFQAQLVEWALLRGRAALFCDCGLGKTPMQLVWAENIVRKTNGRVLILTPLAVSGQTLREAVKFGIEAKRSHDGTAYPITVTNYERLHYFKPEDFVGVVCDESSILKNFDGSRRAAITEFLRTRSYRLACTATAAPNDYIELGTTSEALGQMGHMDMLSRFFRHDCDSNHPNRISRMSQGQWRFRGHAESEFWRWVCSWARAVRTPSDMGCDDGDFVLPPLETREHVIQASMSRPDMLFDLPAITLEEQRAERRRTLPQRCEQVAELVAHSGKPAVAWCHLNTEGDTLEAMIGSDAVQVAGSDSDEAKEEKFEAFVSGQVRVMITKPTIAGFGMNWQHCAHQTFFPSHSFEQFYQAVRRSWRFGQTHPVVVDVVTSNGEAGVLANLRRKADAAAVMFAKLVALMHDQLLLDRSQQFNVREKVPTWLSSTKP